ncbi:MAG: hypothetical protein MUC43_07975 [Pirellula sp.]|jgi:hypothetical protein|nr:hypothetical protein [Pirellula sp.]
MSDEQKPKRNSIHREKLHRCTRQRQERLEKVADYYLKGKSFRTIGELVGISHSQIQRDVSLCKQEWAKATALGIRALANKELAKLDQVEAEAWRAWERSQAKLTETLRERIESTEGSTLKRGKRTKQSPGDPAFLQLALQCINQRLRIFELMRADGGDADDIVVEAVEVIVKNREEAQGMLTYEQFRKMADDADSKKGGDK